MQRYNVYVANFKEKRKVSEMRALEDIRLYCLDIKHTADTIYSSLEDRTKLKKAPRSPELPNIYLVLKKNHIKAKSYYPRADWEQLQDVFSYNTHNLLLKIPEFNHVTFQENEIKDAVKKIFTDPNNYIANYNILRNWQQSKVEDQLITTWLFAIVSYGKCLRDLQHM